MPEVDAWATYYLARWRGLTEKERRQMRNLRPAWWMDQVREDFLAEGGQINA